MSANSMKLQKAAEKNPELLGSTNQGTREHQSPATASKVERATIQANEQEPNEAMGNTANRPQRAIPSEFRNDTDATKDRMEALGQDVPEVPNPQNRFAPNNVGADANVEGQSVLTDGEFPVGISTVEAEARGLDVVDNTADANARLADRPEFGDTTLSDEPGLPRVDGQPDEDDGSLVAKPNVVKDNPVGEPASNFASAESDTPEKDEARSPKNPVRVSDVVVGPTGAVGDEHEDNTTTETTSDKDSSNSSTTSSTNN